jgi:hypothetical protein
LLLQAKHRCFDALCANILLNAPARGVVAAQHCAASFRVQRLFLRSKLVAQLLAHRLEAFFRVSENNN